MQILVALFTPHLEQSGIQQQLEQLSADVKPEIHPPFCSQSLSHTQSALQQHQQIGFLQPDMSAGMSSSINHLRLVTQKGLWKSYFASS